MLSILAAPFFLYSNPLCKLSATSAIRLLKLKAYNDFAIYNSNGAPMLRVDQITNYRPHRIDARTDFNAAFTAAVNRVKKIQDDRVILGLLRSVAMIRWCSVDFEDKEWAVIKGDIWTKIIYMIVDTAVDNIYEILSLHGVPATPQDSNDNLMP